jgi:hypothetical protein
MWDMGFGGLGFVGYEGLGFGITKPLLKALVYMGCITTRDNGVLLYFPRKIWYTS